MSEVQGERAKEPSATIEQAERAFSDGNYNKARDIAKALVTQGKTTEQAEKLLAKMRPDKVQLAILAGATLVFIWVVLQYVL